MLTQTAHQLVDFAGSLGQFGLARFGRLERLFAARLSILVFTFDLGRFDLAFFFEHLQRGIDRTGAWRVSAAGHVFDRADQLVAVARLAIDQRQQCEAQFALRKHPAPALARTILPITPATARTPFFAVPIARRRSRHHRNHRAEIVPAAFSISIPSHNRLLIRLMSTKIYLGPIDTRAGWHFPTSGLSPPTNG